MPVSLGEHGQAVRRTKGCFAGELVGIRVGNFLEHVAVEDFLRQPLLSLDASWSWASAWRPWHEHRLAP